MPSGDLYGFGYLLDRLGEMHGLPCLCSCMPTGAITGERKEAHVLNEELCIKCGACYEKCRFDAVRRS